MIVLTTLQGEPLAINDELIERIEEVPQTRVFLTDGNYFVVTESMAQVRHLVRLERAETSVLARTIERHAHAGETGDLGPPGMASVRPIRSNDATEPDAGNVGNR